MCANSTPSGSPALIRFDPVIVRVMVSSRTARLCGVSAPPRSIAPSSETIARGVLAVRWSITVAGSMRPSSRTKVAIVWSRCCPAIPDRANQALTEPGPPTAASSASVASLLLRVIDSSINAWADSTGPACTRATGPRAETGSRTGSSIGNS